ncbi:MAG TPA: hypothetical protein VL242_30670 [Sorangium sp.]|nr:hypothetical protein [Sorangium sp.]
MRAGEIVGDRFERGAMLGNSAFMAPEQARGGAPSAGARSREVTSGERKVVRLILARDAIVEAALARSAQGLAQEMDRRTRALRTVAERYRGQLEILADQPPVIVLASAEAPTDLVVRAARCALSLRAVPGGAPVAPGARPGRERRAREDARGPRGRQPVLPGRAAPRRGGRQARGRARDGARHGMVQARLEALDLDLRRALRAAIVFGETFCKGGNNSRTQKQSR